MPRGHVIPDGRAVAALRGRAGLPQWELARQSGYGLRTISKIEACRPTRAETLEAVATVLSRHLKRPVNPGELLAAPTPGAEQAGAGPGPLVRENLKLLDLTGCSSGPPPSGVLTDHWRFARLAGLEELSFHYATTGSRLEGRSLSHPARARWGLTGGPGTAVPAGRHLGVCGTLCVPLTAEDAPGGCEVQNRVEYGDGFLGRTQEWFHTHVVYPSRSLSLVIRFPPGRPCRAGRTSWSPHPAAAERPTEPPILAAGGLLFWRLDEPALGATYRIEWSWCERCEVTSGKPQNARTCGQAADRLIAGKLIGKLGRVGMDLRRSVHLGKDRARTKRGRRWGQNRAERPRAAR